MSIVRYVSIYKASMLYAIDCIYFENEAAYTYRTKFYNISYDMSHNGIQYHFYDGIGYIEMRNYLDGR
jgi:hypothetical protein